MIDTGERAISSNTTRGGAQTGGDAALPYQQQTEDVGEGTGEAQPEAKRQARDAGQVVPSRQHRYNEGRMIGHLPGDWAPGWSAYVRAVAIPGQRATVLDLGQMALPRETSLVP